MSIPEETIQNMSVSMSVLYPGQSNKRIVDGIFDNVPLQGGIIVRPPLSMILDLSEPLPIVSVMALFFHRPSHIVLCFC